MNTKLQVELNPAEAIAAVSALDGYLKHIIKHYKQSGVPDFAQDLVSDHIKCQISSHNKLLTCLRANGWPMHGQDLEPIDIPAIMAIPYISPEDRQK